MSVSASMVKELRDDYFVRYGQRLEDSNPTPGNKEGGITTLIEKSIGTVKKMGSRPIQGVLRTGDAIPHPGLWILDQRSEGPDPFNLTSYALTGAIVSVYSSGRGSPVGR